MNRMTAGELWVWDADVADGNGWFMHLPPRRDK
jgi:hypothetical protein